MELIFDLKDSRRDWAEIHQLQEKQTRSLSTCTQHQPLEVRKNIVDFCLRQQASEYQLRTEEKV